ncbi:hypothetical protein BFP77_00050 [Maribacter sp. 4U21]|uniref:CPBP family intramembrane glutamic endopeptidase n=1 Tax=Maribacter sp. 4U21 TaxID=1889779 RepID=UPI000C150EC5|nr:type II CAAX endopeptidase family protein [Maribacter sp. 4U21]PIB28368.1 hypothetical protein BFP77_00050 [Maribacter sp. 4U21]
MRLNVFKLFGVTVFILVISFFFELFLSNSAFTFQKELLFIFNLILYLSIIWISSTHFNVSLKLYKNVKLFYVLASISIGLSLVAISTIIFIPIIGVEKFIFASKELPVLDFLFFGSILLIPVIEELFYRKVCCEVLLLKQSIITTVIISATLFTFAHILSTSANPTTIFIGGIVLGIVYCKTRNVLFAIITHVTVNLFAYPLTFYLGNLLENNPNGFGLVSYICSLLFSILSIFFAIRFLAKQA